MAPNDTKRLHTSLLLLTFGSLSALGCWLSWPARAGNQQRGQTAKPSAAIKQLPDRAKRWALIVGVDDYESSEINDLGGAANDAMALKDALVRYAGFPEERVILTTWKVKFKRRNNWA